MAGEITTIEISDKGIKVDSEGFKDGACLKDLEKIIADLKSKGINVTVDDQKMKPEGMINVTKTDRIAVRK